MVYRVRRWDEERDVASQVRRHEEAGQVYHVTMTINQTYTIPATSNHVSAVQL